jgi:hypothetical protein
LRSFTRYLNDSAICCVESLNIPTSTFVNDGFANRLFYEQVRIEIRSHYLSDALHIINYSHAGLIELYL